MSCKLSVWEAGIPKFGIMKTLLQTSENGYITGGEDYEIQTGKIRIELPKTSATILKYSDEE
jgi:alpha-glucosidase